MDETDGLEQFDRAGEFLAADHHGHVLGGSDSIRVHPSHSGRYGAATDDCMRDTSLPQRSGGTTGSLTNLFHGADHPVPGEFFQDDHAHGTP